MRKYNLKIISYNIVKMNKKDRIELYKNKLIQVEKDYNEKLQQAKKEENHNKMMILLNDLIFLRKFYNKKLK